MALTCLRCEGRTEVGHVRDCPHREDPPPGPPLELPFLLDEAGKPLPLERARELSDAFAERKRDRRYWVEFSSTDDGDRDAELIRLEDGLQSLGDIVHACRHYGVVAHFGDAEGPRGSVTADGVIVAPGSVTPPGAPS
jgi:hypothetical protein